jgi:hypothetical protein
MNRAIVEAGPSKVLTLHCHLAMGSTVGLQEIRG